MITRLTDELVIYEGFVVSGLDYGISKDRIWNQLSSLGFITPIGMIDLDCLNNETKQLALKSWFVETGGADAESLADELISLMKSRVTIFSTEVGQQSSDTFENALMNFDALAEELIVGLTAPATPIYANPEINSAYTVMSPYVIGGYQHGRDDNSLFTRIDHKKLQQTMSRLFALQNTISAFMTMAFSISDMVSSIAAKLGDDQSTASSTAKQRQKIIQSFNAYSSGINESVNTLMDLFEKTIEKTNEARYQTGLAQLDSEYADLGSLLGDEFLGNEFQIRNEKLKSQLSEDYYSMLYDNRQSMQSAMLDVPQFGPNIMPSQFSHYFINDDYGDLSSIQIWAALFANGVIDQYGIIKNDVNLDLMDISVIDYAVYDHAFDNGFDDSQDDAKRMKQFLFEQLRAFDSNLNRVSVNRQRELNQHVKDQLITHQASLTNGFSIFSTSNFNTSQYLYAYMDLMERSFDSDYNVDFDRANGLANIDSVHNFYGSNQIDENDLAVYSAEGYAFPIEDATYSDYIEDINSILSDTYLNFLSEYVTADSFTFLNDANDRAALLQYLVDLQYIYEVHPGHFSVIADVNRQKQFVSSADLLTTLESLDLVEDDGQNGYVLASDEVNKLDAVPDKIKKLYEGVSNADFITEALINELKLRANPAALHLSQTASHQDEPGSGFQMVNTSMLSMALKNFMIMNMTRRVYMTLISAYTQFFENIAGKLSKEATQSSHYSDWQNSLMESHMGIAERQLSTIHSDTVSMVGRINEMHKHRLNLVKLSDSLLRGLDITSTWSSIAGALLMLTPTPLTHFLGIFLVWHHLF